MYKVTDLEQRDRHLAVKVCKADALFERELRALCTIQRVRSKYQQDLNANTSETIANGLLKFSKDAPPEKNFGYFVMPRYGKDLQTFFVTDSKRLSKASIYYLGLALLQTFEQIHLAGYIYNDLKTDNIMINYGNKIKKFETGVNAFADCTINLVDFGFATKYLTRDSQTGRKCHVVKKLDDMFRGNLMFASSNQMQFYTTSRRDDLISLAYLLVYLVRDFKLPGVDMDQLAMGDMESFKTIAKSKGETTLNQLCEGESEELCDFVTEIFTYRYATKPNYLRLHNLLKELYEKHSHEPLSKHLVKSTYKSALIEEKMDPRVLSLRKDLQRSENKGWASANQQEDMKNERASAFLKFGT